MKNNRTNAIGLFTLVLVLVVIITGYVKNIQKFSRCDFKPPYKAEVIHGAGLIPVVGVFTVFMDCGK